MLNYWIGLTRPCVEMDMLYWFGMKQTQMYICTLEEFILVHVVTLLYMDEVIWYENHSSLYTNATIEEKG